ncbi:MAG: UPF0755 protein [Bacteroidetes bacterium]|nr:MAG: UPF0755 protein [Bacteroidota bacterium]
MSKRKKIAFWFSIVTLLAAGAGGWWFWDSYYKPNVDLHGKRSEFLYVRTGWTMTELEGYLVDQKIIKDENSFREIAKLKKFTEIKPGRYRLRDGMSNRELVNMLRAGLQEPVDFTFNGIRTKEQLVSRVSRKIEADSAALFYMLNDNTFLSSYGFTNHTVMTMFIPDTYEMNWNTSAEQFMERMAKEYKAFWTEERKAKCKITTLTQSQAVILASIVQGEQTRDNEEKKIIAGLYLNRLRIKMPLQSDPTLIFALGDFTVRRVLNGDKEIDSPYNTYLHTGLPPGPISIPDISSVDAVLNFKKTNYLYMCAEYGTGHHNFTKDYNEHLKNAKAFQDALNKANINR